MLGTWIKMTTTGGSGNLTLASITGFSQLSDQFPGSAEPMLVEYIISDGNNWEEGIGTWNGTVLARTLVRATYVSGTFTRYTQTSGGTAITATSAAIVFVDISADTSECAGVVDAMSTTAGVRPSNVGNSTTFSNQTHSANQLQFFAFKLPIAGIYNAIGTHYITGQAANTQWGVYSVASDGTPYRVLARTASFQPGSSDDTRRAFASSVGIADGSGNIYLRGNHWYYVGSESAGTPSYAVYSNFGECQQGPMGVGSNGHPNTLLYATGQSLPLPDPAPAVTRLNTNAGAAQYPLFELVKV